MLRKAVLALLIALGAVVAVTAPAQACGYWSCTSHENYIECYWID